jgi:hypothetical protein
MTVDRTTEPIDTQPLPDEPPPTAPGRRLLRRDGACGCGCGGSSNGR